MTNETVLFDILRLLLSYLDRIQGTFSEQDKEKMEEFIRSFFPTLFCLPASLVESNLTPVEIPKPQPNGHGGSDVGDNVSDLGGNVSATEEDASAASGPAKRGGKKTKKEQADLRRKALRKAGNPADRSRRGGTESRAASPASVMDSPNLTAASVASSREPSPEVDIMMSDVRSEGTPAVEGTPAPDHGRDDTTLDSAASPLLRPVPATAAGLESMEGVETISTAPQSLHQEMGASHSTATLPEQPPVAQENATASTSTIEGPVPVKEPAPTLRSHQTTAKRAPADSRSRFNFFCDSTHYFLIRLFHVSQSALPAYNHTLTRSADCVPASGSHARHSSSDRYRTRWRFCHRGEMVTCG